MTSANQAAPVWAWLVGRHPKKRTLAIAGAGGLLLGIVAVATNDVVWWANGILFALAFDLAAKILAFVINEFGSSFRASAHFSNPPFSARNSKMPPLVGGILSYG